jgi:hypothetical protein
MTTVYISNSCIIYFKLNIILEINIWWHKQRRTRKSNAKKERSYFSDETHVFLTISLQIFISNSTISLFKYAKGTAHNIIYSVYFYIDELYTS